ncbi:MAG: hypothetical protein K0Q66_1973 [Chitinophagaceae bacterium]|jgi:uncharacterized damage-inducible protein DinB|nr:hypothetical protein [Chitinophagaceae bacterium]
MKELLTSYAAYNYWANQELCKKILALPQAQQQAVVSCSFGSLQGTVIHMWDAESIWWQRMKLLETIVVPSLSFHPTIDEAVQGLLEQGKQWLEWVRQASPPQLEHVFAYQNTKKENFKQPVWQMLLHSFNHGSFHRGQLVTILRQLGETRIPATDYIHFSRLKK